MTDDVWNFKAVRHLSGMLIAAGFEENNAIEMATIEIRQLIEQEDFKSPEDAARRAYESLADTPE